MRISAPSRHRASPRRGARPSLLAAFVALLCLVALPVPAHADPTVAAVGDLGCSPTDPAYNGGAGTATMCRQRYVSDLLFGTALDGFLALGDNQYANGELANFQAVYDPTFGRANQVAYPSVGNAEYDTPGAKGYFDYFAGAGVAARIGDNALDASNFSPGNYYSFEVGGWHLIALNSNCAQVGGCAAGSPQEVWLKRDLELHPNRCTLAYWHHPRWNSGRLGNDSSTAALWTALYSARADIVVNGHGNHHYERHAPMNAAGALDAANGIREFIVSTGGEHHGLPPTTPGKTDTLQVADYTSFGILRLQLHARSYDWQFVPEVGGSFTDSGSGTCHAGPAQRPAAPSLAAEPADGKVQLSWSAPADGGASISGYRVYRGTAAGAETLLASVGKVSSFADTSVVNGTQYFYRVAAVNSVGEGALSNEVSATPAAAAPPPVPFPATGVLDGFERAAGPLGASWRSPGLADPGTVSIATSGQTMTAAGPASATWSAASFGADQEAFITVPVLPRAGGYFQLAGRVSTLSSAGVSCYFVRVTPSTGVWDLRKKLNGAVSTSLKTFTAPLVAGDSIGLRLRGSTIAAYRKPTGGAWTPVGQTVDTAIGAGGYLTFTLSDTTARGGAFGGGALSS